MGGKRVNIRELEAAAKASATEKVINTFNRPGQLEKIDQIKQRYSRKKASVEALLKSAMQQQLDGVRVGLSQLHCSLEDVLEIENSVKKMSGLFADVPKLFATLSEVREENMRHSQYVTAKENLKHIFIVPDSVKKTEQLISEGKLLHAHQCLRDLENSRDDLLYELHKLPNQSPHDKSMLKAYFADVEELSKKLEKQLTFILSRTLNTVRKDPTIIVTVLRIIEREEKSDEDALRQQKQTGFIQPGRPKKWKDMAFFFLEKSVSTKIEGTQAEDRSDNKLWLIRYLELIRMTILEDLRVVKTLCVPCFPPRYNIIDKYIKMYHNCLSVHLQEIIQNGLEGNEYVTVLSWVMKTYKSEDMLGHQDLKEHTEMLPPLLPTDVLNRLEGEYLKNIENNYTEWMQNTLKSEKIEWRSSTEPHMDSNFRIANIILEMIHQNLQVSKTISEDQTLKVLNLSIEQVIKFGSSFREAILEFKIKYFENREQAPFFTKYMIVIINNCLRLIELGSQLEKQYVSSLTPSKLSDNFNKLRGTFYELRNESINYLLEELFMDLDQPFEKLFTADWLASNLPTDTIYVTLQDYFRDYHRLIEANYKFVVDQTRHIVAKRYLTAMLSRRTTFKTFKECATAVDKVLHETDRLSQFFKGLSKDSAPDDDPFDAITFLAEVLKSNDDMISFELHRVVEKYPDITSDHLLRLLNLRGDLSKSDIKDKVLHVEKPKGFHKSTIFKTLVFPKLNINLNF